jgi:Uma2 family endonuclease
MTLSLDRPLNEPPLDEPLLFPNLTWQQFKQMEPLLDVPGVRLSFLNGTLEIRRMPGKKHETVKQRLSTLLDAYLEFAEIDHTPTGSMTLEAVGIRREADLSYELGTDRLQPDLAIEIVITSGGIDKLTAYQKLKIEEVWFWQNEDLALYGLRDDESGYDRISRSRVLPGLDMALLTTCLNLANHPQAVKRFKQSLAGTF